MYGNALVCDKKQLFLIYRLNSIGLRYVTLPDLLGIYWFSCM